MKKSLETQFSNPGNEFRSAPFWSWNDKLDIPELRKQLDDMQAGGFGGSFFHSRVGLLTPYFSPEWMKCIRECVKYSKKRGMLAYLYDEDRWPSGFAGGLAVKSKKNQMKYVIGKKGSGGWKFTFMTHPDDFWYNNYGYLDVLSKTAVKKFIDTTYEKYKRAEGREFGKTIPGMFTDEPNYRSARFRPKGVSVLPWTAGFDKLFRKKYGYDIRKNFVKLVEDRGNFTAVRHDFWRLAGELLLENYGKQIYDWCEKNNIPYTGHYNGEDNLPPVVENLGSAMPLYEYMHIPGIDHLTKEINQHILTVKQCSSVAHQLGKKRVLSEIYGASGQNLSFAERKQVADWDVLLGINLFCPHLWLYSMRGCRKRDYPPTISYQQPYWKYNKPVEDHLARLSLITTAGTFRPDVLVVHPIESAWMRYKPYPPNQEVWDINTVIMNVCKGLLQNHHDFDLGDESLMAKYGKVLEENGRTYLAVGKMKYAAVILPSLQSVRYTTLALLENFIARGGKVLSAGPLPEYIDGKPGTAARGMLKGTEICNPADAVSAAAKYLDNEIRIKDASGREIPEIYCQKLALENGAHAYLMANTSLEKSCSASVNIKGEGVPEHWDSLTGKRNRIPAEKKGKTMQLDIYFPPAASRLIVLTGNQGSPYAVLSKPKDKSIKDISSGWEFERLNDNSLTLDTCRYKTGKDTKWSGPMTVLGLQNDLEKQEKEQFVALQFRFNSNLKSFPRSLFLVLEQPEKFLIMVNGRQVEYHDSGSWVDISFKKVDIRHAFRPKGENIIELSCKFIPPKNIKDLLYRKDGVELESIYITGDFAVKGSFRKAEGGYMGRNFVLADETTAVKKTDFVRSGYPFYAGAVKLSRQVEISKKRGARILLKFDRFEAMNAVVTVNKREAGLVFLPPYELDITDAMRSGKNLIEIELVNTLRNLLGPHHYDEIATRWTGPWQFEKTPDHWTADYGLVPFGSGAPRLISRG